MSERYSRLFTSPENLYATGSPVLIEAGALLKDNQTGKVLVQLKLQNIGTKPIKAVTVSIQPLNVVGNSLGNEVVYQYLDLNAKRNEEFGSKTPVILHDPSTRSYSVSVQEVIFADNTVWQTSDEPWETLISPVTLERFLNDHELVKQYRIKFGADCKYKPTEQKDLWYCTCGELNQKRDAVCHRCRKALTSQLSVDVTALKQDKDNRTAEEQKKAAEDRAAAEVQAKKFKKLVFIASVAVCLVAVFAFVLLTVIIPNSKYNDAVSLMNAGKYTEAISAFETLDGYKDSANKIAECKIAILDIKYNEALSLMQQGMYAEAIAAFKTLDGYKDSATQINTCETAIKDIKYTEASALMDVGKYAEAIDVFKTLGGYKDSTTKINTCNIAIIDIKYAEASALMDAGKYNEAIDAFKALNGYKDSIAQIEACYIGIYGEDIYQYILDGQNVRVGDHYIYGAYEQDNNFSNGKEPIEWIVLARTETSLLLISKHVLDYQPYNTVSEAVTWETCSLRKWLNGSFINGAFSAAEQTLIATTTVLPDKDSRLSTNAGNATNDKVFLLGVNEAVKYFSSNTARQCQNTAYANSKDPLASYEDHNDYGASWWLRSPGGQQNLADTVSPYGVALNQTASNIDGLEVSSDYIGVRPALWIDLNS